MMMKNAYLPKLIILLQIGNEIQYRLKSYTHRHARTARAERVECPREARDETVQFTNEARAVHERKPRFEFYLGQMDERPTQRI